MSTTYHAYSLHRILLRRSAVVIAGILALPVMLFRSDRGRFYSYLHRVWSKPAISRSGCSRRNWRPAISTESLPIHEKPSPCGGGFFMPLAAPIKRKVVFGKPFFYTFLIGQQHGRAV
jgi:Protein of unknown function (DUF2517).